MSPRTELAHRTITSTDALRPRDCRIAPSKQSWSGRERRRPQVVRTRKVSCGYRRAHIDAGSDTLGVVPAGRNPAASTARTAARRAAYDLMMRRVQIVVGIVLSLICTGAAVAEGAAHLPTLGSARYAKAIGGASPGFGTVAPKVVNANGDPGSVVYDLRWAGWGRAQAVGNGKSYAPGAHGGWSGTLVPSELRATDLGRCQPGGPVVYRHLWFRAKGEPGVHGWTPWSQWPDITYPKPQLLC